MKIDDIPRPTQVLIEEGAVIPAHPLILDKDRKLDEERQRSISRYYLDAGVGGIAVGVHTTQYAIREHGLYEPVLKLAAETTYEWSDNATILVAGVTGKTEQAVNEAKIARALGYHAVLLNLAKLKGTSEHEILEHCRIVANEMPLIGFALLPAVGGFHLSYDFWKQFAQIENVIAIKMAPFDRYRTIDIVRAVYSSGAQNRVTLYTGNDDHIVLDLLQPFVIRSAEGDSEVHARVRGGLLGHWSVWVQGAVKILKEIHSFKDGSDIPERLMALDSIVTDCNSAIYDAQNNLAGCIPGCLEVLRRQGLTDNTNCLNPSECLSTGQSEEIDRVYRMYPEFNDDKFVKENIDRWISGNKDKYSLTL